MTILEKYKEPFTKNIKISQSVIYYNTILHRLSQTIATEDDDMTLGPDCARPTIIYQSHFGSSSLDP